MPIWFSYRWWGLHNAFTTQAAPQPCNSTRLSESSQLAIWTLGFYWVAQANCWEFEFQSQWTIDILCCHVAPFASILTPRNRPCAPTTTRNKNNSPASLDRRVRVPLLFSYPHSHPHKFTISYFHILYLIAGGGVWAGGLLSPPQDPSKSYAILTYYSYLLNEYPHLHSLLSYLVT